MGFGQRILSRAEVRLSLGVEPVLVLHNGKFGQCKRSINISIVVELTGVFTLVCTPTSRVSRDYGQTKLNPLLDREQPSNNIYLPSNLPYALVCGP